MISEVDWGKTVTPTRVVPSVDHTNPGNVRLPSSLKAISPLPPLFINPPTAILQFANAYTVSLD